MNRLRSEISNLKSPTMLPTLLIVDDERSTRDGLRSALEEEFDVYTAAGTGEALTILKSEPIQLLLTDLRLGGESGMDLLDAALGCRSRRWPS